MLKRFFLHPGSKRSIVISVSVFGWICLSLCKNISKTKNFLCMLLIAMAESSYGGITIKLHTFGFADNIMFSYGGPNGSMSLP